MYTPTIGLEVHVELKTKSKMFCGCTNDPHASEPNTNICPICLAHPGTLPVPNEKAIQSVLLFGQAVGGELATYSEFDRKNYFYPDIPKAYQLSQYAFPFVTGGNLHGVALTRVHLEEDTARSQHDKGAGSLIDYNRAGVPLMELVTEPVIHDAKTAGDFARELQLLLRTLGISDANLEKGEMRVEVNISVSDSEQFGTKVEIKNLNSFKVAEAAIAFEIERQTALLESGQVINQETRGWDESKQETYLQRSKETAKDYRYFPDPDIPKYQVDQIEAFKAAHLADIMPILPTEKREKYSFLGLPSAQIEILMANEEAANYFENSLPDLVGQEQLAPILVNYLLTDLTPLWSEEKLVTRLTPAQFVDLIKLVAEKKITSRVAKDLITEFANTGADLVAIANDRGLINNLSTSDLESLVATIIAEHPTVVAEYQAGKVASLQFLLGQAMKVTKGVANPVELKVIFEKLLK